LKRYVESGGRPVDTSSIFGGSSASLRPPRQPGADDEDSRSVSTAFASQVGGTYD
jgi:regulator of nonsense transcripts 1